LLQIAGLCYLTNSFALLLAPDFEHRIFPAILAPAFIGELSLALWLSLKGVDVAKWQERASALRLQVPQPCAKAALSDPRGRIVAISDFCRSGVQKRR